MATKIRDLQIGETAQIIGYEANEPVYRSKLLSMGLTKGTEVTLLKIELSVFTSPSRWSSQKADRIASSETPGKAIANMEPNPPVSRSADSPIAARYDSGS